MPTNASNLTSTAPPFSPARPSPNKQDAKLSTSNAKTSKKQGPTKREELSTKSYKWAKSVLSAPILLATMLKVLPVQLSHSRSRLSLWCLKVHPWSKRKQLKAMEPQLFNLGIRLRKDKKWLKKSAKNTTQWWFTPMTNRKSFWDRPPSPSKYFRISLISTILLCPLGEEDSAQDQPYPSNTSAKIVNW